MIIDHSYKKFKKAMTKEQYSKVERFKPQFNQAKSNFIRIPRGELEIIRQVYNELFNAGYTPANLTCNHCVLKMMKQMAEAVEKYEQWRENFKGGRPPKAEK